MSETYRLKCPECGEIVEMDPYDDVGDEIECYSCGSTLIIKQTNPVRLGVIRRGDDTDDDEYVDESGDIENLRDPDD